MQRLTKLALVVALVAAPFAANARSGYLSTFNSKYGTSNTALDTCDTCHGASTSSWNAYGQDLMKAGNITAGTQVTSSVITSALTAIEPNDSDGDRYTNITEITARTFPGNASSFPVTASAPKVAVAPTSLSFGTVTVGTTKSLTTTVSNTGNASLTVSSVARCSGTSTEFTASPASFTVAAGGSATVTVSYRPADATTDAGCIAIASNDATNPTVQVGVGGTGQAPVALAPAIAVAPTSLSFGTIDVGSRGQQTTIVSNAGNADLVVSSVAACAGTSAEFTASPATFTVAPNGSQTVTVSYDPIDAGTDTGCVAIASNDTAAGMQNVSVTGTAQVVSAPVGDVDISRFGVARRLDLSRGTTTTPKLAIVNPGTVAADYSVVIEGADATGVVYTETRTGTLAAGATAKVLFHKFVPTAVGTVTWTVTVTDADPDTDVATATTQVTQ